MAFRLPLLSIGSERARCTTFLFEFEQSVALFGECVCLSVKMGSPSFSYSSYSVRTFLHQGVEVLFFISYFVLQIREAPGPSSCDYSDGS